MKCVAVRRGARRAVGTLDTRQVDFSTGARRVNVREKRMPSSKPQLETFLEPTLLGAAEFSLRKVFTLFKWPKWSMW
jgi:hypothetical protein